MARPIANAKTTLSCSVPVATKELLETKSKAYNKTMSDLVDKLIVEAFSPKRGLAKRLEADRAAALKLHTKTKSDLSRALLAAEQTARRLIEQAKEEYTQLLFESETELSEKMAQADAAWSDSLQAMALQYLDNSEQKDLDLANFWLFEHRVLAAKDKFSVWHSGGSAYKAAYSFMNSTMTPDKLLAADLAAEGEMYELPADAFDYIVSCYEGCVRKAFEAFDAPIASEELRQFYSVALDCDSMYGTKAAANLESRLEVANKVTIDWAKKRVDLMLKQGLTPSDIYNDLTLSPELRQRGKELMDLQQL